MTSTLLPPEPTPPPPVQRRWNPFRLDTTLGRQRIVGALLFMVLFGFFFSLNRFPKLDTVREDVAIATQAETFDPDRPAISINPDGCFQGFCFDNDAGLIERWWDFSLTYIELVTVGMIFAFLVAGLTDAFLFPTSAGPAFGKRGWRGALQGLTVGPLMTLCSACIVPVANSLKKQGAGVEATIAVTQGSSTLNAPAMIMVFVIFSPLLAVSRVAISIVGALALGPVVAWLVGRRERDSVPPVIDSLGIADPAGSPDPWSRIIIRGVRDWMVAAWRFFYRLTPVMVLAGFVGGFAIQFFTEEGVSAILGNHALGIAVAATFGILINVPLLFEIPLVAGLMLLGMGVAPAAVLLFAAAAAGPITFWGMSRHIGVRAVAWFAVTTWVLAAIGGFVVLGADAASGAESDPVVSFNGDSCSYSGPSRLPALQAEFMMRNDAPPSDAGHTLAVVIGRLPDGDSSADLARAIASDPTAPLPGDFVVAGTEEFIFPETGRVVPVVLHSPGDYAAVCLHGGGNYVILEFSMPQPPGWFDEFRDTFRASVAEKTFEVRG